MDAKERADRKLIETIWRTVMNKQSNLIGAPSDWKFWLELLREGRKAYEEKLVEDFYEDDEQS